MKYVSPSTLSCGTFPALVPYRAVMRAGVVPSIAYAAGIAFFPGILSAQTPNLDSEMVQLLQQNHVPSVSIAQITDGKIALVRAYGQQDATTLATPRTLYNIASLTKPITAQVAMRLLSQGVFTLDEPMAPVWTDPDIAADDRRKLLTPRIALTHQTGFANWRSMTNNKLTFQFTPGTRYSYSGEGFEYLARFMEKKTGLALDANAKKLVFDALGMHDTAFTRQSWFQGRVASPADAKGTWLAPSFADHLVSADMVYTTAHDYALLLQAVMENRGISRQIAHERDTVQVSLKEQMCPKLPANLCPDALGSGLSWQIFRFKDTTVLMHTGHDPGLFTFAYVSPTARDGAVILTNGENGRKLVLTILRDLNAPAAFTESLRAVFK
jgi:CubicO group peptidase (beta-lactamase class C family)